MPSSAFSADDAGGLETARLLLDIKAVNFRPGEPYTLTAELMSEEDGVEDAVRLTRPQADIMLNDGSWLALSAETGVLVRESELLTLEGGVSFFSDAGYEFRTPRAEINLATKRAHGTEPIFGQGPFGTLSADGFRLENQGKTIFFEGNVRMTFYPKSGAP